MIKACICLEQNMGYTEHFPCQGTENLKKKLTKQGVEENKEEDSYKNVFKN